MFFTYYYFVLCTISIAYHWMSGSSQFPIFSACKSIKLVKKYGRYWFEIHLRRDVKCDWQSADFQEIHSC